MQHGTVIVVAGGEPDGAAPPEGVDGATVIAADGGVDRAHALGLHVDLAIGDFDSVSDAGLAAAEAAGARLERHPTAKDATDLELALDAAIALGPERIVMIGSGGGRLDHLLGSLLLLADERYAGAHITAELGDAHVDVVRGSRALAGEPGALVSLLPVHGAAAGVTTEGLAYPLDDETLPPGTTRGVSNVFSARDARVTVTRGCLLAVQPGQERILVTRCHKLLAALAVAGIGATLAGTACGAPSGSSKDVVLVTHDAFAIPKAVKAGFEAQTGYKLRILQGGDAGEMLNRALLTKGNPQGDAIFGVDNNLLSRAVGAGLLEKYTAKGLARVPRAYRIDPTHELTPVDHGDVCLNVDKRWFASHRLSPPTGLGDLTKPAYRKLLVVENPATSTPGLAFMLATIARYGESGWEGYWEKLRGTASSSSTAGRRRTRPASPVPAGSKGDRPIVVSYATSPPAEVIFAKARPKTAPTAAVTSSCFRQVELAGVLKGARNPAGAKALLDFMLAQAVPGGAPGEHVRVARAQRHATPGRLPPLRRLARQATRAPHGCDRPQPRPLDRRMDTRRPALTRASTAAVALVPLAFLGFFFVLPLATILERGLTSHAGPFLPAGTGQLVWFTVWQAAASTALTLVAGLPLAWALGRFRFRGRSLARALVLVPFVLPTVVVATAFLELLPSGSGARRPCDPRRARLLQRRRRGPDRGRRLGHGRPARRRRRPLSSARGHGAALREVTLPQLAPALSAAGALTFLFCFTSFGVILILGGPGRATVETEIYNRAARLFDLQAAAALSLLQLGAVAIVLAVASLLEARAGEGGDACPTRRTCCGARRARERLLLPVVLGLGALLLGLPLAVLVRRSLGNWGALFDETPALLVEPWRAAEYSIAFASAAALLALVVGGLAAVALARRPSGFVDGLVLLPLGASAVMLGFGFIITFDESPIDFRSSWWLVPVAQSLVAAPFVVRIVTPALRTVDPRLREVAATLGAVPWPRLARGRPAARLSRVRRRRGLRLRDRARRVRGYRLRRACRAADPARGDLPIPRPAGRDEPGDGRGAGGRPCGRDGVRGARGRAARRPWEGAGCDACLASGRGARVTLGGHAALAGVDLEVDGGTTVAVLGPSGSGKSTLLRAIAGLQRLDARGRDAGRPLAAGVPAHRRGVGLMFQDDALFLHRDVAANIAFGLRMQGLDGAGSARVDRAARARRPPRSRGARRSSPSRAASASASRSHARSRRARGCCSSTSRSARSTGRCTTGSYTSSGSFRHDRADRAVYVTHDVGEAFALVTGWP